MIKREEYNREEEKQDDKEGRRGRKNKVIKWEDKEKRGTKTKEEWRRKTRR